MTDRLTVSRHPALASYLTWAAEAAPRLGALYMGDEAVTAIVEAADRLYDELGATGVGVATITPGDMTRYDIVVAALPRKILGGTFVVTFPGSQRGCIVNLDGGDLHPGYLAGAADLDDNVHASLIYAGVLTLLAGRFAAATRGACTFPECDCGCQPEPDAEYPEFPCPDDPDGMHHVGCGCLHD